MFDFPSFILASVSPLEHPYRTGIFSVPILLFSYWSLQFFRSLRTGVTIFYHPRNVLLSFRMVSGKRSLSAAQKKLGLVSSFNSPAWTAFLGLFLFAAAEFLLVLLFKRVEYTFLV